jgi:hypothetical protein
VPESITDSMSEVYDSESEDERDVDSAPFDSDASSSSASESSYSEPKSVVRPFEKLASLPADLNEAFELFKLAIISHKLTGWDDIALEDVLATLDALKQLAIAPTE